MTTSAEQIPGEVMEQLDSRYEALEAEFAPDICNTLGLFAVKGDLARTVVLIHAGPWLESELPDVTEAMAKELQSTRDRIAALGDDNIMRVGSAVLHRKVPEFLLGTLGVEYDHFIFERLIEQTDDGSYAVSDETLLNFLQWHNHSMTDWRKQFVETRWPQLKDAYVYQLESGVRGGWIPNSVLHEERLNMLDQVEVTVDDGMLLHETGSGAYTLFDTTGGTEVCFPPSPDLQTAYHELSHVMEGVELEKDGPQERFGGEELTNQGLYRLFDKEHVNAGKLLDEAVTEHMARTMGEFPHDPDTIYPFSKKTSLGSYIAERELLGVLCSGGKKPVDVRLFMNAYFEDSTHKRQPALKALRRALKKAFPRRNVLNELGILMAQGEYNEAREGLDDFIQSLQ